MNRRQLTFVSVVFLSGAVLLLPYLFSASAQTKDYRDQLGRLTGSPRPPISNVNVALRVSQLFPVFQQNDSDHNRAGYMDRNGNVVIDFNYYSAGNFSEDLASVTIKRNEPEVFIDRTGRVVLRPMADETRPFSEGLAAVRVDRFWGFIDKTGKLVIQPQFDFVMSFRDGLAPVFINNRWGYIDRQGQFRIRPIFDGANLFSEGVACVIYQGKAGYISKKGEWVIEPRFQSMKTLGDQQMLSSFWEDVAVFRQDERYGFINMQGDVVIPATFERVGRFSEGLAVVSVGGRKGYINKTGSIVIAPQFEAADYFSEGLAGIKINNKWGFIDQSGVITIKPEFDAHVMFTNGLAQVWIGVDTGYVDKSGKYVWRSNPAAANPGEIATDSTVTIKLATHMTDGELIASLQSNNPGDASMAVQQVLVRGERLLPLLLQLKGKRKPFIGSGLGSPRAAQAIVLASPHKKEEAGRVITIEVASLYLISALYYQSLSFAQSPYLTDLSIPPVERRALNADNLVAKAWASTESWARDTEKTGLAIMRSRKVAPLSKSAVAFW